MSTPGTGSPSSGAAQTLVCPHCQGSIRVRQVDPGHQLRCSSCRGLLGGPPTGPVQWLYPERRRLDSSPGRRISSPDTFATGDTLDLQRSDAPDPGPRRIGRYELRDELGRGGMGVVYAAWDEELRREVALKVLLTGGFASAEARARFVGEARAAAGLHHVHIVRVFDMGEADGQPWFAMERVFGPSLEDILATGGALPVEEATRIGVAVAEAVAHAHTAGVAHRDLKPGNVLLDGDGHPRITDFGLARQLEDTRHLTATQQVLGTPSYMPPEVARAERGIDWIRADVYGLGGVLYAALTGGPPVKGTSLNQRLEAASRGDHHFPRRVRPEIPVALDAIVAKALHPDPASRYPHAAALAADLRRFRDGEPITARPDTDVERLGRWSRRHARSLGIAGVVTVVLAVAAAWAPVQNLIATRQREAAADRAWAGIEAALGTPAGEEQLEAFVEAEHYRGTTAVARAWLRHGDDLAALPHPHGELGQASTDYVDAWARALTESPDPVVRGAALARMARAALARRAYGDVNALLRAIEELPAGSLPEAERVPLALAAALRSNDRERAAAAWDRAVALDLPEATTFSDPRWIPEAFRSGTRILGSTRDDALTDERDPHGPAFLRFQADTVSRLDLVPTIRVTATAPFVWAGRWVNPDAIVARRLGPEGLVTGNPTTDQSWGDVDRDGVEEGYESFARVLYRVAPDGRSRFPIVPEVSRTGSEIAQTVADLDGDGHDELVVALSEWRAYDVRVYTYADGRYQLRARLRANRARGVTTLPDPWGPGRLLVVSQSDNFANGTRHGVDTPDGPGPALRILRLVGDTLEEVYRLEPESGLYSSANEYLRPLSEDLDGDGAPELVVGLGAHTLVLRPGERPGSFRASLFASPDVHAARQLDDDPAMELLARTGQGEEPNPWWILGRGDEPLPVAPPPPQQEPLTPPEGALDGPMAQVWRDAAVLTSANLLSSAASLLERAAALGKDPDLAAAAASLWQRSGSWPDAAEAMALAARSTPAGPLSDERWSATVTLWLDAPDPAAALDAADQWRAVGTGPSAELAERLGVWEAARGHRVHLEIGEAPTAPWQVVEPLGLDLAHGRTRSTGPGGSVVAQVPVVPAGGGLALFVDGSVDARQGGAHVWLGEAAGFMAERIGLEKSAAFVARCDTRGLINIPTVTLPPLGTKERAPIRLRMRLTWTPADPTWRCSMVLPDEGKTLRAEEVKAVPSALALTVKGGGSGRAGGFDIERVEAWGFDPVPQEPTARDRANLALVHQNPAEAIALLPEDAALDRAVAFALLRRPEQAIAEFRRAFRADPDAMIARLPFFLHEHREVFAPLVRPAVGDRWAALLDGTYHPELRNVYQPWGIDEALRVELEGVPFPDDPEDPGWCILADRVGALARGPDPSRAVEAGREWLAAFAQLHVPIDTDPWILASKVHRELAFEAAARGDREAAMAEAQASVDVSPTPVIAVDRVWISPIWQASGFPLPVARPRD